MRARRAAVVILSAVLAAALAAPGARSQTGTDLKLRGGLTARRIEAFGTLEPPANRRSVRVRLLIATASGYDEVARKRVALNAGGDSDGDGRRESRFLARFPSPSSQDCKLVARFAGTRRRSPARRAVTLPCNRPEFPTGTARLSDLAGSDETTIDVEIADSDALRAFGLMFKRRLADDRGMAFLYPTANNSGGYWMKNTLIPLSIGFFDGSGMIVRIMDMEPCPPKRENCPIYDPETSYAGALEVNQGAFDTWSIEEGDFIEVTRD